MTTTIIVLIIVFTYILSAIGSYLIVRMTVVEANRSATIDDVLAVLFPIANTCVVIVSCCEFIILKTLLAIVFCCEFIYKLYRKIKFINRDKFFMLKKVNKTVSENTIKDKKHKWIKYTDDKKVCPVVSDDLHGDTYIGSYGCRKCENNICIDTAEKYVKCKKENNLK